jgi:ArsR family transcriptional regulator
MMKELAQIFKSLSDTNRIRILKMLEIRPLCVCEITAVLGLAMSTVSKHLSILRESDLIFNLKENKWVNYYLNATTQKTHTKELLHLLQDWLPDEPQILQDREKVNTVDREMICVS